MTDAPDDRPDDGRPRTDETPANQRVPDAEWEQVAQKPIDAAESDSLTTTIVSAIADAEGVPPKDIKSPPLYNVVDTAALEVAVFGSGRGSSTVDSRCSTEFMYRGYRVVVQTDGWVQIYEQSDT